MIVKKTNSLFLSFIVAFSVWSMQVNGSRKEEVTKDVIGQYQNEYKKYVLGHQKDINRWYEYFIMLGAKRRGYNKFSRKCIRIVYTFFKDEENQLKKVLGAVCTGDEQDLEYINDVLNVFNEKAIRNKNVLTRILHRKHVYSLTLSEDIDKEFLVQNPEALKKLIDQGKINLKEYYRAVALNLFIQFWLETIKKSI